MKYRRLSEEELQEMEQEFIQYLVANGIDAGDWKKIQQTDEATNWIENFSDVVLQKALEGIKYLEFRSAHEARFFECGEKEMNLVAMTSKEVDLTNSEQLTAAINQPGKIELFKGNKKYSKSRELELFEMTQSGCEITDGKLYLLLMQMV